MIRPDQTEIDRWNRALMAFAAMTGARDSAIASMKLKHVDLAAGSVFQDAREVDTKFSKSFTTYFFPVGSEVRQIFDAWVTYLGRRRGDLAGELDGLGYHGDPRIALRDEEDGLACPAAQSRNALSSRP